MKASEYEVAAMVTMTRPSDESESEDGAAGRGRKETSARTRERYRDDLRGVERLGSAKERDVGENALGVDDRHGRLVEKKMVRRRGGE